MTLKRGEVYWVSFDPAKGGEIQKTRPAMIVSNDHANALLNRVQVVPLTSNTNKVSPSEALISVNGRTSKAAADQIRTVSKHRLMERIGTLTSDDMNKIELAILRPPATFLTQLQIPS